MLDRPHFIIIGAMKCATSTLHEQLAAQRGILMSDPKEPNFFSNDEQFELGVDWYMSLFRNAGPEDICGESSTHYTKLPTYPQTVTRMRELVPHARLIYVMRDPIKRLESQYVHEWTQRLTSLPIDEAAGKMPEIVDYSRYATQLEPFLASYGPARVLPVFVERIRAHPQRELARICRFVGYQTTPQWNHDLQSPNQSAARMRKNAWRDVVVNAPILRTARKRLIPRTIRNRVKALWQMKSRPQLGEAAKAGVIADLDAEMARLGRWLGVDLSCDSFSTVTSERELRWTDAAMRTAQ